MENFKIKDLMISVYPGLQSEKMGTIAFDASPGNPPTCNSNSCPKASCPATAPCAGTSCPKASCPGTAPCNSQTCPKASCPSTTPAQYFDGNNPMSYEMQYSANLQNLKQALAVMQAKKFSV